MKTIDLINLPVEIVYHYESASTGCIFPDTGEAEYIPASLTISSVKSNGIEIISLIPEDQLREMEEEYLQERNEYLTSEE